VKDGLLDRIIVLLMASYEPVGNVTFAGDQVFNYLYVHVQAFPRAHTPTAVRLHAPQYWMASMSDSDLSVTAVASPGLVVRRDKD